MKTRTVFFGLVSWLALSGFGIARSGAAAEMPSLSAQLDPDRLAAGEMTSLSVTLNGSVRLKGSPDLALQNLEVVAGPSIENRFEWINGKSSNQTILVYRLRALRPGPASVGPVRVLDALGRTLEAPRVAAIVEKPGEKSVDSRTASISSDPALVARIEPAKAYTGQQMIWTLYLVTRGRATQGEIKSLPDFKGFWAEDLDREPNVQPQLWTLAGGNWHAYPMIRKALFADRPGTIPVAAARALIAIRSDFFDLFGDSPFSDSRPVERESAPMAAVVRPLPENAARFPVGAFTLKSSVDRQDVPPGGSFSVTASLSGDGRLADVPAPALTIAGARISEPEARLSIRRTSQRLLSTRTWQWVVTPEKPGAVTVPALRVSTFNPVTGRVAEVVSQPWEVVAAALPAPPEPAAAAAPSSPAVSRTPFPTPAVVIPALAVAGLMLLAIGYRLGRFRSAPAAAERFEGTPEARMETILSALSQRAGQRGGQAPGEVASLRDELARVAFSPQLSSREEALAKLETRIRRLARRWKVRI
ncbi:MAG: BatD family protein [Thermoanaerobaculia bacterium]